MNKFFVATIKSSRGIDIFKFHTAIPESKIKSFNNEILSKVKNFYFDQVEDIEILAVQNEQFIGRM